jgi:ribosomal protein S18 acetylase RimI-like enzyme
MNDISPNSLNIELRAYCPEDDDFIFELFTSARAEQFSPLGLETAQLEALLRLQYLAQTRDYEVSYPRAAHTIIWRDTRRVGRLLTQEDDGEIVLVDIAVLPQWRNHGIGTVLIRRLQETAAARGKPVRLNVAKTNRALGLYRRLGFVSDTETDVYLAMAWPVPSPVPGGNPGVI